MDAIITDGLYYLTSATGVSSVGGAPPPCPAQPVIEEITPEKVTITEIAPEAPILDCDCDCGCD